MDEVTWGALALSLTIVGGLYTWWAWRRNGAAAGLRGTAYTLLPISAWLTGTLKMFTDIAGSVSHWATHLVFNPFVWAGVVLAGTSATLFVISRMIDARQSSPVRVDRADLPGNGRATSLPKARGAGSQPALDDDLADIEALLRKRGIT